MTYQSNITTLASRRHSAILEVALQSTGGNRKKATTRLLEAISANEGDSDLGCLIDAMLGAGDFYVCSHRSDYEDAAVASERMHGLAEDLAEQWRMSAEYHAEEG
ncbi:hypothetical protein JQV19_08540 [Sulfitobacter mediterraneus]|uniref:hypothetical protein n=1 Tax=Sulfitobacter mediterraneus TaxID=83219 RepID=UPI00193A00D7|nr:hypothetical protein [Sulfitobacter mediterraneus]MBM1556694.1 hypothetical protein [Sulfitobacter mediterraneus]MBM1570109.1 hypothetical protein [Sulfitobacter mediterraneus]MBM1574066.1 hypothetical protein [Sulfitobacter mediterraneus]MBM1577851.1 hypothetical protein [Sulfitobacter mediterraneus]MBM1579652.1 hypothetical protein [Sulfitobacter mediterraneus]